MTSMANNQDMNPIVRTLRARFVETAQARLDAIDTALQTVDGSTDGRQAAEMKEIAHSLKGMAGSFGFMSVTRISEAFEDYLAAALDAEKLSRNGARRYHDAMRRIIDSGDEPSDTETDAILADLPAPTGSV